MKPLLIFHNHLWDSPRLLEGRLVLVDTNTSKVINTYIATSGLPGYQDSTETSITGKGSIPETIKINGKSYAAGTIPLDIETKGVEGKFYPITPFMVSVDGVERGDFGIHRDANVPGSSGCIVLTTMLGWMSFQKDMASLARLALKNVPLIVSYSK